MAEPSAALVKRAQAGDREAVSALVQRQQTYVYSIAMSLMHNPADAADMTQEAFIRLLRSLGTYRGETKFTTWLYRLVTNICLDGLRRRGRPVESLDEPAGGASDDGAQSPGERLTDSDRWNQPAEQVELRESATAVRAALDSLPAAQRLALTLHYFDDLRSEDIADVMGLPLNTVKSHIRRGKERLARAQPTRRGDAVQCADVADLLLGDEAATHPDVALHVADCGRCAHIARRGLARLDGVLLTTLVVAPPPQLQRQLAQLALDAARSSSSPWWSRAFDSIAQWNPSLVLQRPQTVAVQGLAAVMLALASWQILGWFSAFQPVVGDVAYAMELVAASTAAAYVSGLQLDLPSIGVWSLVGIGGWLISEDGLIGRRLSSTSRLPQL